MSTRSEHGAWWRPFPAALDSDEAASAQVHVGGRPVWAVVLVGGSNGSISGRLAIDKISCDPDAVPAQPVPLVCPIPTGNVHWYVHIVRLPAHEDIDLNWKGHGCGVATGAGAFRHVPVVHPLIAQLLSIVCD